MAIDLGTAYISVVPTTKDLDRGIRDALNGTVKHADKAGKDIGERITKQVGKSGDRSGEAFARGFGPRVQSAGRSALQGLANLMVGGAQGIGGELGGGISAGMTTAINKGAVEAIDSLAAVGTKGGAAMSSKLQTAGMLAAGGVALVGTAAIAATAELYKIGAAWDDISDGITAKTGLIGSELNKVTDSVKKVALETAAAPGDIAKVTAELVQTLKLSGAELETVTKQISDYNEMNKDSPLNVREFAKAMKQFGITSTQEMSDTLDRLNNVAQNTGIPLNELVGSLRAAGPVAREFKMPLSEITQLLSTFEQAGLNANSAATLLKIALGNLAKDNPAEDPVVALQRVITEIQNLSNAGRDLDAIDLAKGTFGRSWDQILPLIKENKLEVDNLNTSTAALGPTIDQQREATADFAEEWRKFKNFLEIELAPAAEIVFGGISTLIQSTLGVAAQNIRDIRDGWNALFGGGDEPAAPFAPGALGGGPNASRERRGLPSVGDPVYGGGGTFGGVPGTAGRGYFNSRAAAAYLDQQVMSDAALLSNVPAGRYTQAAAGDLTQGLADCSSAIEDLVNIMDGRPTGGRSMSTANAAEWLTSRGFRPGTAPGAFNVGFNSGHMQATLPGGTPFNWGSDASAARGGVGGSGAFDPAFTQQYYRYDTGGWLPPGSTMVQNDTGKPELILNPEQVKTLGDQGVDPNTLLHGTGNKAAPGPMPDQGGAAQLDTTNRTSGFVPVAAGNTGVAGTSFVSGVLNLGNEAVSGAIDAGAQLAQMAASAAISAGTMGGGAGAGPAASAGIQIAANVAKRASAYGFQMAGIGADSLIAQLFPFGAPRWLGYDYTQFTPQMTIGDFGITTGEKAANQTGQPAAPGQDAGGPVQPQLMPGVQQPITEHQGSQALPGPPPPPGPQPLPPMQPAGGDDLLGRLMGYDQGGMLPPGGLGINMTNRPEPVLTPKQWDNLTNNVPDPQGGQAPLVKIDAIYGMSPDDVANKIESKQKLAMMRYAGRP